MAAALLLQRLCSLQGAEKLCAYLTGKPDWVQKCTFFFFTLDSQLISQNAYRIKLRKKPGNRLPKTEVKEKE